MTGTPLRIVYGAEEARQTLLARQPLEEYTAPPALQAQIQAFFGQALTPDQVVQRILAEVKAEGDVAVRRYALLLDGIWGEGESDLAGPGEPASARAQWRVSAERIELAWQRTGPVLRQALELATQRIERFHQRQPCRSWVEWDNEGGGLGQIVRPLERVGIYAPNGRASYPSSLLMAAIPARVAGVPQVVVATPPRQGKLDDTILAAARVAGVSEVYALGGAQAIAALAYGTASVPRVDKILGPGNIFVVLAKRRVFGSVDIDQLPGPTETLLVADETANPAYVAADILAQAEHDPLASALLITTAERLAFQVQEQVTRQLYGVQGSKAEGGDPSTLAGRDISLADAPLARREIIEAALAAHGGIVVVDSLEQALELANAYAPEHLCLLVANPWAWVGRVKNAGGVFLGELSSEPLGDYVVGPSHIMPTGQTARFSSPVNVWDFVKITSLFGLGPQTARAISPAAIALAEQEGLTAHAQAVRLRLEALHKRSEA